jgi:hypothetical protein
MKFAAAILNHLSRNKADEPDAFDLRLMDLGPQVQIQRYAAMPTLFRSAPRAAA